MGPHTLFWQSKKMPSSNATDTSVCHTRTSTIPVTLMMQWPAYDARTALTQERFLWRVLFPCPLPFSNWCLCPISYFQRLALESLLYILSRNITSPNLTFIRSIRYRQRVLIYRITLPFNPFTGAPCFTYFLDKLGGHRTPISLLSNAVRHLCST